MHTAESIESARVRWAALERPLGFVPTMGALHEGHIALIARARERCASVAASVFVNPLQFGANEDFERYPRDLDDDRRRLADAGVDLLFAPPSSEMYRPEFATVVDVDGAGERYEGLHRPGHFRGVTTVMAKLLNIVRPDVLFLGQKDAQQAVLLRRMIADLDIAVEFEIVPTVREADGLAMSSRNRYLDERLRSQAPTLYRALQTMREALEAGASTDEARRRGNGALGPDAQLDYLDLVDEEHFQPLQSPAQTRVSHRRRAIRRHAAHRQPVAAMSFENARILLGVTGGIAAYKAAALTSTLVQNGAEVDVVMTAAAERFIAPLTFASLTARPVYASLWDMPERIPHIRLVREAQVAMVVPATADFIAKLAAGIADDLLSSALLAARIPRILAPAMNAAMYEAPSTETNLRALRERGYEIVEPERGFLAERESGIGRLASEDVLIAALRAALTRTQSLRGKRVVITAGPTREAFDPVRFLSNASTGATGIALAREAALRGGSVTLLLGPTLLEAPAGVDLVRVTSARDLYDAAMSRAAGADLVIATAAVADWRPAERNDEKQSKSGAAPTVVLEPNPDVLAALGERKGSTFLVGFAAETHDHETNAREKLRRKHLDAIAVNDVRGERGFGTGDNEFVLLYGETGRRELGRAGKTQLAVRLLDAVEELMRCS